MKAVMRRGFTLVELLVVIAVIGLLIAMLLPAVQASREASRRAQCTSNLARLGMALHSYESAYESLPPGVVNPQGPIRNAPQGYHMSWITQVLPYIDEDVAYRHIDFSAGVYDPKNCVVRQARISTLLCPTDRSLHLPDGSPGQSSYAGCHHDVESPIDADNHGVLFLNSHISTRDVTDGVSHTIYAGEKLAGAVDLGWMSGTPATLRNTGAAPGAPSMAPSPGRDAAAKVAPELVVGGFTSFHPTGANVLFGDGVVQFFSHTVDRSVFQQLGHRADGKLLNQPY